MNPLTVVTPYIDPVLMITTFAIGLAADYWILPGKIDLITRRLTVIQWLIISICVGVVSTTAFVVTDSKTLYGITIVIFTTPLRTLGHKIQPIIKKSIIAKKLRGQHG